MIRRQKIFAYWLCAALGLVSTSGGASATCGATPAGTWHFFAIQGHTPDIKSTSLSVRTGPGTGSTQVTVFKNPGSFQNSTANIIKCVLTVKANGTFTDSPCSYFGVTPGETGTTTVTGNLALSSCNFTGTIAVGGDPTPVTIQAGHINGNNGAGIATQGPQQVMHFTLVKN